MPFPRVRSLFVEPFHLLVALSPVARLFPKQDHFAPHLQAQFEGYYTRILTSSGATILLVFSSVFSAVDKPHFVHFAYLPRDRPGSRIVVNKFPRISDCYGIKLPGSIHEFSRVAKGDGVEGTFKIGYQEQRYRVELDTEEYGKLEVSVDLTNRKPWIAGDDVSTPEGIFSELSLLLPLHWNVFSTASSAAYTISQDSKVLESGVGIAHLEKNWGVSFPRGWTWVQGFSNAFTDANDSVNPNTHSFVMAGGKTIGQKAYLIGYRSESLQWSFRPPFTMLPFGLRTPFMSENIDSKSGIARLEVCTLFKKLVIEVVAPANHEGWLEMCCPLSNGHGNSLAYETIEGKVTVTAYKRGWCFGWKFVEETVFNDAAVEFGGDYSFKNIKN